MHKLFTLALVALALSTAACAGSTAGIFQGSESSTFPEDESVTPSDHDDRIPETRERRADEKDLVLAPTAPAALSH